MITKKQKTTKKTKQNKHKRKVINHTWDVKLYTSIDVKIKFKNGINGQLIRRKPQLL